MSLHLSAMQAMAEYSGYAGVFCRHGGKLSSGQTRGIDHRQR